MFVEIKNAVVALVILTLITGVGYPLLVTALARIAFPAEAEGSLLPGNQGSTLIAQPFSDPKYFWPRLSGAGYNGGASSGTNFAPSNPARLDAANTRIAALKAADPDNTLPIPVDLVTASASGLDPEISLDAATYQLARVARVREMDTKVLQFILDEETIYPDLGFLGEPRVNVLRLNLRLDGKIEPLLQRDEGFWRGRAFLPD